MARIWLRVFLSIQKEAVKMRVALAARGNAVQVAVFFQKFLSMYCVHGGHWFCWGILL